MNEWKKDREFLKQVEHISMVICDTDSPYQATCRTDRYEHVGDKHQSINQK